MTTLQHPATMRTLKVLCCTVADGTTRWSSTGSSTACLAYPIPEAPEHSDQLGDRCMSLVFEKPVWIVDEIKKYEEFFPTWLKHNQDNPTNRREFAKEHYGCTGRLNIAKTDLRHFYPLLCTLTHLNAQYRSPPRESCMNKTITFRTINFPSYPHPPIILLPNHCSLSKYFHFRTLIQFQQEMYLAQQITLSLIQSR